MLLWCSCRPQADLLDCLDQRAAQAARKILILRSFIQKYKKVCAKGRPGKGHGTSTKGTGQALLENSAFSRMAFSQIQKVAM